MCFFPFFFYWDVSDIWETVHVYSVQFDKFWHIYSYIHTWNYCHKQDSEHTHHHLQFVIPASSPSLLSLTTPHPCQVINDLLSVTEVLSVTEDRIFMSFKWIQSYSLYFLLWFLSICTINLKFIYVFAFIASSFFFLLSSIPLYGYT